MQAASYLKPELEPGFIPFVLRYRQYCRSVEQSGKGRKLLIGLTGDNSSSCFETVVPEQIDEETILITERIIKSLLWIRGGNRVALNHRELARKLAEIYSPKGGRAFDASMMSKIYAAPFEVVYSEEKPNSAADLQKLGGHTSGCRIGFDLGATNRKCAAVMDNKVVFTGSLPWDPAFQTDPNWHREKILEIIRLAAKELPRVDAVGGSSAGVIINNKIRLSSLFRGIPDERFEKEVSPLFDEIGRELGVPLAVANDGEVTALAGAEQMKATGVLGVSMGSSTAGGYVDASGFITTNLNELAFVPVDLAPDAAVDEWSGDIGCGVQYFSQQGAVRLAQKAGITFKETVIGKQFYDLRDMLEAGDQTARKVFETIGVCFGYALAGWSDFYDLKKILLLGGVAGGPAFEIIKSKTQEVLEKEFPELYIEFGTPEDSSRGQAVAAASLI